MKKQKSFPWRVFALITLPLSVSAFLFLKAGPWLAVDDTMPPRIDIIFTPGGETARVAYSRELARRFPRARWVVSDIGHRYARMLAREKFDLSRVTFFDTCAYTLSEIKGLAEWLQKRPSAVVNDTSPQAAASLVGGGERPLHIAFVSNPFHMRRIKYIAAHVFRDPAIRCYCLPVPPQRYGWTAQRISRWWETRSSRTWVGSEIGKLFIYWALFSWA